MGLPVNDSHLWNMCAAAEQGWLRWDISKAWASQPGSTHGLSKVAAGTALLQAGGNPRLPTNLALQLYQHPSEEGPVREAGARLTEVIIIK